MLIDIAVLEQAKSAGADSLWYKDSAENRLMEIVQQTIAGEHIFPDAPPPVQIGMAKSTEFTKTNLNVLHYLLRGQSYPRIALEMGIEVSTVEFHVTNMLQKTGLENKLQFALAVSEVKMIVDLDEKQRCSAYASSLIIGSSVCFILSCRLMMHDGFAGNQEYPAQKNTRLPSAPVRI